MRVSGRMLATVLNLLKNEVKAGMTTKQLAQMAAVELRKLGGKPAFLGYMDFPDVICISVNDEVVHGIPKSDKIISQGDIVGLDFGVTYKGMITDAAISVIAGGKDVDARHAKLLQQTEQSMMAGIGTLHDNVRVGDIGAAVQSAL